MGIKVTNNAFSTLAASISAVDTTIVVGTGQGNRFPTITNSDYFYLTLIDTGNNIEIVKCTARTGDTLTVVRGQDGTTALAFAFNSRVELRPVAALFDAKADSDSPTITGNATFAKDITVNGLTVGRGDGNISTNTALGVDAIGSPYITSTNTNNVGIGYGALNQIGSAVASLNSATLVGGSGYNDDYNGYIAGLTYLSGTPPIAGAVNPDAFVYMSGGQIVAVSLAGGGFGWTALDTVFAIDNAFIGGVGSGASIQIGSLTSGATNNTAVGVGAGSGKILSSNSVYLGYNTIGSGSNQILIGSNVNTGNQNNVTIIGNSNTTSTIIRGQLTPDSFGQITTSSGLTVTGTVNLSGSGTANQFIASAQTSGSLTIGGTSATGLITLGRSTGAQTVNIATGVVGSGATKTVNIGTGSNSAGSTVVNIGQPFGGTHNGNLTVSIGRQSRSAGSTTIGIGNATVSGTGTTNITIGNEASTTSMNGNVIFNNLQLPVFVGQNTLIVEDLFTATVGTRAFVTDASTPVFGQPVSGGGSTPVPVYYDGNQWRVG